MGQIQANHKEILDKQAEGTCTSSKETAKTHRPTLGLELVTLTLRPPPDAYVIFK